MRLTIELDDVEECSLEDVFAYVTKQIQQGYTSGYYPYWTLEH